MTSRPLTVKSALIYPRKFNLCAQNIRAHSISHPKGLTRMIIFKQSSFINCFSSAMLLPSGNKMDFELCSLAISPKKKDCHVVWLVKDSILLPISDILLNEIEILRFRTNVDPAPLETICSNHIQYFIRSNKSLSGLLLKWCFDPCLMHKQKSKGIIISFTHCH